MNKILVPAVALVVSLTSSIVFAQQKADDMKGMDMGAKPAAGTPATTHHATGVVKKLDAKTGTVTFAHDAVKSMNWPAMTMGFQVKDKMLLDKLKVGQQVDFDFEKSGSGYLVTAVK